MPIRFCRAREFWLTACVVLASAGRGFAAEPTREARRSELTDLAMEAGERLWSRIAHDEPDAALRCRGLLSYALAAGEAGRHPERIERLLTLAARMQDRDPASATRGNFRWSWGDRSVTDRNAVEFCSYDMHLLWRLHRDGLTTQSRDTLRTLMEQAVEGLMTHRAPPSYTNIAILNAANLITLGESLARTDAADEGYRRLAGLASETWQFGLCEYASPTYYAIDSQGLSAIERFAEREAGRETARAILELLWTDIAVNFLPGAGRLAGPHSRSYDYLHGLGLLQQSLRWEGWIDAPPARNTEAIHVSQGRWSPPARLLEMSKEDFPRLVRQSWGRRAVESRTHWLRADVSLGSSAALYGPHDCPLTFDLSGKPGGVRGFFIPDGREDPYGRKPYRTDAAGHRKPLHLRPFWAAAQREGDAVALVVYRDADLEGEETVNLQSHVVLPRDVDGIWLRGRRLAMPGAGASAPQRIPVAAGDAIVLRQGSAAVGLKVVWSRATDERPAEAALVDDRNEFGALRITIDHRRPTKATAAHAAAAAALWVQVAGSFDRDEAFAEWREAFERGQAEAEASPDRIAVSVPGRSGRVAVAAEAPFDDRSRLLLDPSPSRAVLELDGVEIGRPLLARFEPFASFAAASASARPIDLPAAGNVRIEAESGVVLPGMELGDDGQGTRYVWQPDRPTATPPSGSVSWTVSVALAGRYRLWGRTIAPDGTRDSFSLSVTDADHRQLAEGHWHVPRSEAWAWNAAAALDLPAGEVRLTLFPREPGTKLDALRLTSDQNAQP